MSVDIWPSPRSVRSPIWVICTAFRPNWAYFSQASEIVFSDFREDFRLVMKREAWFNSLIGVKAHRCGFKFLINKSDLPNVVRNVPGLKGTQQNSPFLIRIPVPTGGGSTFFSTQDVRNDTNVIIVALESLGIHEATVSKIIIIWTASRPAMHIMGNIRVGRHGSQALRSICATAVAGHIRAGVNSKCLATCHNNFSVAIYEEAWFGLTERHPLIWRLETTCRADATTGA
ncbi:hypothetical protein C8R43DRAFT_948644 [Mycena crocata]|nr:hypothetical protein C8R43DRAFT_948644 [Mycena crocata]